MVKLSYFGMKKPDADAEDAEIGGGIWVHLGFVGGGKDVDSVKISIVFGIASAAAELPQCRQTCSEQEQSIRAHFSGFAACKHYTAGELGLLQLPESAPSALITTVFLA